MIVTAIIFLLLGLAAGAASTERTLRVLRTELNSSQANVQLLLTRLASRTPAEYHAVVSQSTPAPPVVDNTRYLHDETGLIQVGVAPEDEV